jgi:E3 ubiquitin-protein ligase MYCBP2
MKGRVVTEGDIYFGKLEAFAMHICTFYDCFKCKSIFFGGMQDCADAMGAENTLRKENLLCNDCKSEELGFGQKDCKLHGNRFIDFKCMYCCSVAMFVCSGASNYFCQPCHNDAMNGGRHNAKT